MKSLFEVFDAETLLKLVDDTYYDLKKISQEERKSFLINNTKYYYCLGRNDKDVRNLSSFLKQFQNNALCIAEASKRETNRDNIVDENDRNEFDEIGYIEYKYFQIYLLKYNDGYYILSKPVLMKYDDVLMLQNFSDFIESKIAFYKVIDALQKEYNISLLKDSNIT